jgi:hypothetical protein
MQKENKNHREIKISIMSLFILLIAALTAHFKLLSLNICLIIAIIGGLFLSFYLFLIIKNKTGIERIINWVYIFFLIFVEISLVYFLFII